jgi:hypothetical protein
MAASNLIVSETHQIKAGGQFDGQLPSAGNYLKLGNLVHVPDMQGGRFTLPTGLNADTKEPIYAVDSQRVRKLTNLRITFGGQSSWSLFVVDSKDNEILWLTGSADLSLIVTDQLELAPCDWIKLVTVGASAAMVATIAFETPRRV